ncbi:hypothetical protein [Acinetobacter baumannii]|uniref:hypothetical protein n=1 Tax=Acinetobacter baumannii TaxID=470 RepID=UPI0031D70AF0
MDKFEENLREILAQSKHKSSGAERFVRASLAENKYPREFLIYFLNSECFGDYESENPSYEAWQHQQAKVEELKATIKGNHGRIAELERLNRVKAQAIIDLHQEITELKASHHGEVIGHEVHFKKIKKERYELQTLYIQQGINMLKLQKRVKFLEQELGAWKGKSIAAMVNGMCKQCGKEPLQAIVSDKEGYALLHCFGCGADKYELIGEQALKGEG